MARRTTQRRNGISAPPESKSPPEKQDVESPRAALHPYPRARNGFKGKRPDPRAERAGITTKGVGGGNKGLLGEGFDAAGWLRRRGLRALACDPLSAC
eukprot:3859426-Pleurochrysis_carterae.AAC.1